MTIQYPDTHIIKKEIREPSLTWLLTIMAETPFEYIHPLDENRVVRVSERYEDCAEDYIPTMLSVMWTLSMDFCEARYGGYEETFGLSLFLYVMLANMGLLIYKNDYMNENGYDKCESEIREKMHIFMQKMYKKDGSGGGAFVLKSKNIRDDDLWLQMDKCIP